KACLASFLPVLVKKTLEEVLADSGVKPPDARGAAQIEIVKTQRELIIGEVRLPLFDIPEDDAESRALIPSSKTGLSSVQSSFTQGFFDNPLHAKLLRDLAIDFSLGEHLLLIGNQGVGKNKITDRFLELLGRPREYIQLHRDTTVSALTVSPSVENGVIIYNDSPLVRAVTRGRVLVVDEADKAPIYITSTLKSLAETGEMTLTDGRRIRKVVPGDVIEPDVIPIHPDFRMIVLANRPGYPFMGNDFFSTIGEVFSCHPIDNPDPESELILLRQAAPSVDIDLLKKLIGAFGELREAFDDGLVNYPYSLRELLNIVRHMETFPGDPLDQVLRNVFDFDVHRRDLVDVLAKALARHGLHVAALGFDAVNKGNNNGFPLSIRKESVATKAPPEVSGPKHGKVDKKNDPHVGGNTWAGGTGGSDTAGLGGRGGPYRLDSGNPVHQLSDEKKAAVPPHVLEAARKLGKEALEKRLKEIKMSTSEAELYGDISERVRGDVQRLRVALEGVRAKERERVWLKNQVEGELDDAKLIEGVIGETSIYKVRGEETPEFGLVQKKPKRIKFVFDVSGSMYRFNGYDGRLSRSLETALMIMESLEKLTDKYRYDIVGHSGDSECIEFVNPSKLPANELERLKVLQNMAAHSQYCWSGDNTLEAARRAMKDVVQEEADDYFVIIISDANLSRYGISAAEVGKILESDQRVNAAILFIGSIGEEAKSLVKRLPPGKGFVAFNSADVPRIIKQLFSAIA
ncbi:hypothetical protein HDU76_008821, partial [Blyttiomyces sp. JEL0837]